MLILKIIKGLIKALHSDISPRQIAGGVALGSIIGLTPFMALHNLVVFVLIMILNVNIGAAFLAMAVFGIIGLLTDPIAHQIGYLLLVKTQFLTPLWTSLYGMPIVPFTRFNNTVVLGSLVLSLILLIPVYLGSVRLISGYRERWRPKVEKLGIVKWFKLTSIFNLWDKYR